MGTVEVCGEVGTGTGEGEERIHVSVRLRPLNSKEILRNDVSDWECVNDATIVYKNVNVSASERSMYPSAYKFDRVFKSACSTREVYEKGAKEVAMSAVNGINSSVFAYGQTSSGKTYTMTGVTEYAIADIYEYIRKNPQRHFTLKFSAMEIYNESVRDLLCVDCTPLRLLDDPERGTVVEKLMEEILRDWNHVTQLLSVCETQRQIGETSLNEMSSRSHQIIRLTIESSTRDFSGRDNVSTLTASVNFIDLAGSERAPQSLSAGTRLKEGCHINRSLLTLGTVVRKLSKGRNAHIPYRDSKLTRILQTSLGGNARTAIICTMSPARSHVEQSRNTLLFASCAKDVTTNAQVNVVLSDKALIRHLQRELARLESEIRLPHSPFTPSNYSETLRDKDLQIEELGKEIEGLILQRDIAQAQVKEMQQMLGNDAGSITRVGLGQYLHRHVETSPNSGIPELEKSILAGPHSLDGDTRTCSDRHSRSSSDEQFAKIPYFDMNFVQGTPPPRILRRSLNCSEDDSSHVWEELEKQSNVTSEDLYQEVRSIEMEESSCRRTTYLSPEQKVVEMSINRDGQDSEFSSPALTDDRYFTSSPTKNDNEMKMNNAFESILTKNDQEILPESLTEVEESASPTFGKGKDLNSIRFLDMSSLEKLCVTDDLDKDSCGVRRLTKSQSCRASIITDSAPPCRMLDYIDNTPSVGSEQVFKGLDQKISPLSYGSNVQSLATEHSQSSWKNALDIEIGTPEFNFLSAEDVPSSTHDSKEKELHLDEQDSMSNYVEEIKPNTDEFLKKSVKDVGIDPMEDDPRGTSSWPTKFKRLQKEILELWQACHVSLVHRAYFFLLFRGDLSDAIYLEVEMRRMKFLNDKFSHGEKSLVNGKWLTLASSAKTLRRERRMLINQMTKKLSENERESLFLRWGIDLNTKLRRLQLAHRLWTNIEDMTHIADSAFLVVKLVGSIEPGQAPKEMFGLNFTPRSTRSFSFRRNLISLF